MKKLLPVVLVLILLAGVGWYLSRKQGGAPVSEKSGNALLGTTLPTPEGSGGVISSIKDAIGLGKKMKCTYTEADGKGAPVSSTIFVDGQKYKFVSEMNGEKVYGLSDGGTQYTWTTGKEKQGWKMTKACLDEIGKTSQTTASENNTVPNEPTNPQDLENSFDSAQNVQCEPSAGEDFSAPTDITFVDQCELFRNSTKALEGIKDQLPAGVNIPGY